MPKGQRAHSYPPAILSRRLLPPSSLPITTDFDSVSPDSNSNLSHNELHAKADSRPVEEELINDICVHEVPLSVWVPNDTLFPFYDALLLTRAYRALVRSSV